MEHTENENKAAGAPSELNGGLECIDASMVKRLAEQTTLNLWPGWVNEGRGLINLIAFAKAVAEFEREQCAKVCSIMEENMEMPSGNDCANAIRMRSNVKLTGAEPRFSAERPC